MKKIIAVITIVLMFPSTGFAMYQKPLEVINALQSVQYEPQSFSLQFSLFNDEGSVYGTIDGKGKVSERASDIEIDAKANVVIDIPGVQGTLRGWLKMSNGAMYFKAESTDADMQTELSNVGLGGNMWIKVPLDDLDLDQEILAEQEKLQKMIMPILAEMFSLQSAKIKNGHEYTLELKPNFLQALNALPTELQTELSISPEDITSFIEEVEPMIAEFQKNLVVKIKVWTNAQDSVTAQKGFISFTHTEINASLEAMNSIITEPVKVIVPASRFVIDANEWNETTYEEDYDTYYDEDWSEDVSTEEETTWEEPSVNCWDSPWYSSKPSRRSITEYKKQCE